MLEKPPPAAKASVPTSGEPPPLVGVLMLDTRFPRFPGDIGDPASQPWPTLYRRVPAASVARVVVDSPLPRSLVARFAAVGRELVEDGAEIVATSCGFLHAAQEPLARALPVPLVTSSLVALPRVHARHAARGPIGVLTFDARRLGAAQLGHGGRFPTVVQGMEGSRHFYPVIAEDRTSADRAAMERDAVAAARRLARAAPAAVILECTNLSPYREAIRRALGGVPVFDLHDAIRDCADGLDARRVRPGHARRTSTSGRAGPAARSPAAGGRPEG